MTTGTTEQIRTLAEKVMGWTDQETMHGHIPYQLYWRLKSGWNPFTNAAHAEMLMDRMRELGWRLALDEDQHGIGFFARWRKAYQHGDDGIRIFADNWRMAVCLAALEAINAS